jgi:hypothetical protein
MYRKKRKNIQKNEFLDLCLGLICVKMDLKFRKKNTVAHSIPDDSPRK